MEKYFFEFSSIAGQAGFLSLLVTMGFELILRVASDKKPKKLELWIRCCFLGLSIIGSLMTFYSSQYIKAPDLMNLTSAQLEGLKNEYNLDIQPVINPIDPDDSNRVFRKDCSYHQYPLKDTIIKKDSRIAVLVCSDIPNVVLVPNLIGLTLTDADRIAKEQGFNIVSLTDPNEGSIIRQTPLYDGVTKVAWGTTISVNLGIIPTPEPQSQPEPQVTTGNISSNLNGVSPILKARPKKIFPFYHFHRVNDNNTVSLSYSEFKDYGLEKIKSAISADKLKRGQDADHKPTYIVDACSECFEKRWFEGVPPN